MGPTGPGTTRNAFGTPVAGGSHIDGRYVYRESGSGFHHTRTTDRRNEDERDKSRGRLDSATVEVRHVDSTGFVWDAREMPRLYLPVSGDFNDMTYDPVKGSDGKTHMVLLDGMTTLFPDAKDQYSPDVGDTPGTCHLPGEPLPILPGRRFGEKKLHADITFVVPDTTVKSEARAGDGPRRQGLWSVRRNPILNPGEAAKDRDLRVSDVRDYKPEEPLLQGTPGKSAAFPFLHERLSLDPFGNVLLDKSNVISPFGGVLDDKTVRKYLELGSTQIATPAVTTGDYCSLLPMAGSPGKPVKLWQYSYMVGIALLAEWVERISNIAIEVVINIKRNHAYNKANAKVIQKLWCAIQLSPEVQKLLPALQQQLEALNPGCMAAICQPPCQSDEGGGLEEPPGPGPGGGGSSPPYVAPSAQPALGRGGIPSDRRLKDNLVQIGTLNSGLALYRWAWNDRALQLGCGDYPTVGVLAQDVVAMDPEAVGTWQGYLSVDYERIW